MARLKKAKKLEERIAPSVLGVGDLNRCGNNFDGSVPGYPSGHIGPNSPADPAGAVAPAATPPAATPWATLSPSAGPKTQGGTPPN